MKIFPGNSIEKTGNHGLYSLTKMTSKKVSTLFLMFALTEIKITEEPETYYSFLPCVVKLVLNALDSCLRCT